MSQTQNSSLRWVNAVSWVTVFAPFGSTLLAVISATYIRLSLGRWPLVYMDTVHAPFADVAATVTALWALALFPMILLLPAVAVIRRVLLVRPSLGLWAVTFVIGWTVAYALVVWDPTGFIDWAMD